MKKITDAKNLAQAYQIGAEIYKDQPAFATRSGDAFQAKTFGELYESAVNLSTALIDLGLEARDHVGLLADNRYEWILTDYAIQLAGAADVPRGTDVTDHDITYIIPHSDSKIVFVENAATLAKIQKNKSQLPNLKTIILMDPKDKADGDVFHLYDLIEKGKVLRSKGDKRVEARIDGVKQDDLFTLIYTSGTTGAPKGVMLTHGNIISQMDSISFDAGPSDRILSILPVWHIFERVFEMMAIACGSTTYYSNVRNLREDLAIVKPTFMASAPRLWESIYVGIMTNLDKAPPVRRGLFKLAYFFASHFKRAKRFLTMQELDLTGRNIVVSFFRAILEIIVMVVTFLPYLALDAIVLSKIRKATGGQLRGSCSGGGALPTHVDLFFNNVGIPVLEGYGLTETSPVLSVRTFDKLIVGTVGPLFKNTHLKLIDLNTGKEIFNTATPSKGKGVKGEIHVKGPQVMKGYYKNPEATKKVLTDDGWFNTGDLGVMTYNNCVKIVGRSKETIVLLGGENVEPVPIENTLVQSPIIDQCMLVGQDQKTLGALIVVSVANLSEHGSSLPDLAKNDKVRGMIKDEIKRLISTDNGFKSFEKVVNFALLEKPFEVGDELTAKLSLKRHVITDKYKDVIAKLYT